MKKSKVVSVIIPNYNYGRFVAQAIESVMNQTYSNLEIIVVNNGSTDNSLEILMDYQDRIKLVSQENLGQSGARNSGLQQATGDFIAFLDADDTWEPQKIEKQIKLFNHETELVYCGITRFRDLDRTVTQVQLPTFSGDCRDDFVDFPGVSIVLSGESTAMFTKSLLEKVGGFDSRMNSAAGWDFFRRCSKFTKFDYVPTALTNYRLHASNMSNSVYNNVSDIRISYQKLFEDTDRKYSKSKIIKTWVKLEYSFLKTFIKSKRFSQAFCVLFNLVTLRFVK